MHYKSVLFLVLFLVFLSCNKTSNYQHLEGNALGTTFSIAYNDSNDYSVAVDSLFTVVNHSLSTYHANSIISRINRGDSLVVIDEHFKAVFYKAKRIHKETAGYFDPTVGILVNAWGFGPKKPIENLDSTKVKEMMKVVGFEKLKLNDKYLYKQHSNTFIDFNAIAKGYAVDVIGQFLENNKVVNYMVEIGGEIRVRGVNPNEESWIIGIEKPLTDGSRSNQTKVQIQNSAMATSGNYRKFKIDEDGKKYVHTINPKTGYTEQNDLLSASVIAPKDCADVDAYATAFMAMGYDKTREFLTNHADLRAILIYIDDEGNTKVDYSFK